jgi:hypothetical protein
LNILESVVVGVVVPTIQTNNRLLLEDMAVVVVPQMDLLR